MPNNYKNGWPAEKPIKMGPGSDEDEEYDDAGSPYESLKLTMSGGRPGGKSLYATWNPARPRRPPRCPKYKWIWLLFFLVFILLFCVHMFLGIRDREEIIRLLQGIDNKMGGKRQSDTGGHGHDGTENTVQASAESMGFATTGPVPTQSPTTSPRVQSPATSPETTQFHAPHLKTTKSPRTTRKRKPPTTEPMVIGSTPDPCEQSREMPTSHGPCRCPVGWNPCGEQCWKTLNETTQPEAKKECEAVCGHLPFVNSTEDKTCLNRFCGNDTCCWLGVSDDQKEGTWQWPNGSPLMGQTFWRRGEPNNSGGDEDCAQQCPRDGGWNDVGCYKHGGTVCSRPCL